MRIGRQQIKSRFHPLEEVSEGPSIEPLRCPDGCFHPLEEVSEVAESYMPALSKAMFPSLRGSFGSTVVIVKELEPQRVSIP